MKAVVLLSGGIDSSVALLIIKEMERYDEIYALTFDYDQKAASKEIWCAKRIAERYKVNEHRIIKLPFIKEISYSGLTDNNIKLSVSDGILEYVPMRNTIFLSIATAWAESIDADIVATGSNPSDTTCPDNSSEYLHAFQNVVRLGSVKQKIKIYSPLSVRNLTKKLIVKTGIKHDLPFKHTWSCHNNTEKACGICGNCIKRLNAFQENNLEDPIEYENIKKRYSENG